jgi:itaconate CoA-transferase
MTSPPLEGITVVAVEQAVAAPFATRQLADFGARVIKIERPDGGDFARGYDRTVKGLSSFFVWLNRSKESLTLDLKHPAAAAILARLLDRTDVFVQNLAPGAADRLGFAPPALRARYPRLVSCSVSGYGTSGPYAHKKAYDMLVQAETGVMSITGTQETPSRAGIAVADIAAGMYAYSGILMALFARTRSGDGTTIDVSLFDSLAEWMSAPTYYTTYGGIEPPRTGDAHATIAPYELFTTKDGAGLYIAIQNDREWRRLCADVLGQPALAEDERFATNGQRVAHRGDLRAAIEAVFAAHSADEIVHRLEAAEIAFSRRNSIEAFVNHPQLVERQRWRTVDSPAGPLQAVMPPANLSDVEPVMGAIPALGQHTDAILGELGFDERTIDAWRQEKVV